MNQDTISSIDSHYAYWVVWFGCVERWFVDCWFPLIWQQNKVWSEMLQIFVLTLSQDQWKINLFRNFCENRRLKPTTHTYNKHQVPYTAVIVRFFKPKHTSDAARVWFSCVSDPSHTTRFTHKASVSQLQNKKHHILEIFCFQTLVYW